MKIYEITFITREEPKDSSVKADIEALGGRILSISNMGQKTFVYPIGKDKSGFYSTYLFEIEPEKLQDFNRKLALEEEILRHLIIAIRPSEEAIVTGAEKMAALEVKPVESLPEKTETEIIAEPELALEIEPEKSIEIASETEIVAEEAEEKIEEPKKTAKAETKKTEEKVEKPAKKEKSKETVKETKPDVPAEDEEERLEALDKKLEELLKE